MVTSLNMATTRRQKSKGKSLRLTDFFPSTESLDSATQLEATKDSSSSPPRMQSGVSPNSGHTVQAEPHIERDLSLDAALSTRQSTLKRGMVAGAIYDEGNPPLGIESSGPTSLPNSSASNSPAKSRTRLDSGISALHPAAGDAELVPPDDVLNAFPTSNQAVSESFLKEMMLALRSSIQQSFTSVLNKQMSVIDDLGDRVNHVEQKMGEFSEAHNGLVDAHGTLEEEVSALTAKLADLEDRNRRNNVKFRGVPESVSPAELSSYVQQLLKAVLPTSTTHDLVIDRAHRLPKPKALPDSIPRDVIARIHFFHIKEDLMQTARKMEQLPEPFHKVKLFTDLSQHTIRARQRLAPITSVLRQHRILYRWGFPTKLIISRNGSNLIINSLEDGPPVFKALGIDIPPLAATSTRQVGKKLSKEWASARDPT